MSLPADWWRPRAHLDFSRSTALYPPAVKRRALGRDLGLTLRMLFVGAVIAALYLVAAALSVGAIFATPGDPRAWIVAPAFALMVWGHYSSADRLLLRAVKAESVSRRQAPELHALVERLCALADLPKPRIVLLPAAAPNAFAAGRRRGKTVIAVSRGLLERLEPRELEAVVAHEVTHLANRDAVVMTFASFFALCGAAMSRRRLGGRDFAEEVPVTGLRDRVGFALVKPFALALYGFSLILMLAISRYREYAADRGAAMLTGAPEQLMSALQKISREMAGIPARDLRQAGLNALFILPAGPARRRFEFLQDHPPLEKRLHELAELAREFGKVAA
jgi:heat shock protein HtpX